MGLGTEIRHFSEAGKQASYMPINEDRFRVAQET